ncbi:hypothetical protein FIBSPDRAFT_967663 [Athelia psychrophila]|uniref:Uncharacterized protein n=1 Tax=Athelia psychrophila TaxID=1759441 RepID=A0A167VGR4_9AGAM|nr:hypothetical protein FIBSPDRAFT_967663 [Fibularhizoctonia sp. CBS 109695]
MSRNCRRAWRRGAVERRVLRDALDGPPAQEALRQVAHQLGVGQAPPPKVQAPGAPPRHQLVPQARLARLLAHQPPAPPPPLPFAPPLLETLDLALLRLPPPPTHLLLTPEGAHEALAHHLSRTLTPPVNVRLLVADLQWLQQS